MTNIAVSGSKGRMGAMILNLAKKDPRFKITGNFDKGEDAVKAIKASDVLVEFTSPEATMKNLEIARKHKKAVVIGTTGLDSKQQKCIEKTSAHIPIVASPNMAVGVNLLFALVSEASCVLDKVYKASISETHHVHKKDAPSGTAKKLAALIAEVRQMSLDKIKVESKREGEVTGEHTVCFDGPEERLELKHSAKTRQVFAKGALEAARFAVSKKKGLYNMFDVLGLK